MQNRTTKQHSAKPCNTQISNSKLSKTRPIRTRLAAALSCSITLMAGGAGQVHAQQVAILDTGIDPSRGFNVVQGFNFFTDSADTNDVSSGEGEGHGTVAARVITESFSGEIVPFVVTDGNIPSSNEAQVTTARNAALNDILGRDSVRVVGISWGTSGVVNTPAPLISSLSSNNKVVAILAGDDGASNPNALATANFNLDGVIIVGATDADGNLLANSNRAGSAQDKFVATIGLPSPGASEGETGFATARISGIAGAVLLQNPNLTAAEVVDVILQSAEDRGAVGTDAEFGRGVILNAQQVLNNVIGPIAVPTPPPTTPPAPAPEPSSGGGGGGGGGGVLLIGGALAGALLLLRKPSDKLEKTLVLDSYGRSFELDLNNEIEINDQALHLNEFFHSLEQTAVSDGAYIPSLKTQVAFSAVAQADPREDMIKYFAGKDDKAFDDEDTNVSVAVRSQLSSAWQLNAGYKVSPQQEFSGLSELQASGDFGRASFLSGQSFGSVVSGFTSQAETLSVNYSPKGLSKTNFKLGLVSADGDDRYQQESTSSIFEGTYEFADNANLKLQVGQLDEKGSVLGSGARSIFGVESATTYALNLTGSIKLNKQFNLIANYGLGRTKVEAGTGSLLSDFSTLRSDWYSVGAVGNNVFRRKDQMGFAVSQPLKIREGALDYSIPVGRFTNGDVRFDTERVNLADTNATETRIEGYYRTMLTDRLELGGFLTFRDNPNHVSELGDEAIVMATLRWWQR